MDYMDWRAGEEEDPLTSSFEVPHTCPNALFTAGEERMFHMKSDCAHRYACMPITETRRRGEERMTANDC